MEKIRRVDKTTTLITDDIKRVPKRADGFVRAYFGDLGKKPAKEIRRFINAAYEGASRLIEANGETLEAIAAALLEDEVLDGEEIYDILAQHSDVDVEEIKKQKSRAEREVTESV